MEIKQTLTKSMQAQIQLIPRGGGGQGAYMPLYRDFGQSEHINPQKL